ncbi:hypothetical protein [Cytobacillus praedii]|uniref:Uncharacterized protein n=1 Tax=Cytobacillus praedii TaxID=1742358 RepID=A0A4R1B2Q6_9BACI|nr:hypothetical protein [Cytobacillus praedii]TCJ04827.1 hypothetical protein E0Y62_08495 [Cytobacillus praedii]
MLKKKIIISVCIFSTLFSCAWMLEKKGKRDFYMPEAEEVVEIIQDGISLPEVEMVEKERVKAFGPREYIRINMNKEG